MIQKNKPNAGAVVNSNRSGAQQAVGSANPAQQSKSNNRSASQLETIETVSNLLDHMFDMLVLLTLDVLR